MFTVMWVVGFLGDRESQMNRIVSSRGCRRGIETGVLGIGGGELRRAI